MKQGGMLAMILAGGRGSRLHALTDKVAKPAVSYGGKYRIVDFPLSNCANSGIDIVGVLTQYESVLLNSYVAAGSRWGLDSDDSGVFVLTPREKADSGLDVYRGTADAISQNIDFIDQYNPDYLLVLSGDHIYKMNYDKMLQAHKEQGANATIAVRPVPMKEASRFGIMNTNEDGDIVEFEEKPANPKSNLASMGIYIFTWKDLRKLLIADMKNPDSDHDFGKNIIPNMLAAGENLWPYRFKGYWRDVGTIKSLWDANMDMLTPELINLFDPSWPILSRSPVCPPHFAGEGSEIIHSIISEGCEIYGHVEKSVLSPSVKIGARARVLNSVLMPGAVVEDGAVVEYAIVGEKTVIHRNAHVGSAPDNSDKWGIATCGPNIEIKEGAVVPAGAMIYTGEEV